MNILLIILGSVLLAAGLLLTFLPEGEQQKDVPFKSESKIDNGTHPEPIHQTVPAAKTHTEAGNTKKDDAKKKGNDFEGYVADILAANGIKLKQWNQGSTSPGGVYAENELNPDFFVEQSAGKSPVSYWVECKYRSKIPADGFTLETFQLERYKTIQKDSKRKIVIALGVDGMPSQPARFYVIPLDSVVRFKRIPQTYLDHYEIKEPSTNFAGHISDWFFKEVFKKSYKY